MAKYMALFLIALMALAAVPVTADEDDAIEPADIMLEKDLGKSQRTERLSVVIHKAGHLEGRPYVIQISELCPVAHSTQDEARVIDTASACDIAANTLEFDAEKSEVSILVREPAVRRVSGGLQCQLKAKKLVFQLYSGCGAE